RARSLCQVESVVLTSNLDVVKVESGILISEPIGRHESGKRRTTLLPVDEILAPLENNQQSVVIRGSPLWPASDDENDVSGLFHVELGDPDKNLLVALEDVVAVVNLQHDCETAKQEQQPAPRS
ncbi:unnamed protein product, partial [Tilletia controversa]